jgi:ABC-2 type transport system ATP-binding protein
MDRPDEILVCEAVTVAYGQRRILDGISVAVRAGEALAVVGPNGSGKSTLLKVIAGVREADAGRVRLGGLERREDPRRYARQVGWSPQQSGLYEELTIEENLRLFGRLQGLWGEQLRRQVQWVMNRLGLLERARQRVDTLSGGWKQRVSVAAALVHNPIVVLLDEPTASLDSESRERLLTDIYRLREEGCTVLLATHRSDEIAMVCDRVVQLEHGQLISNNPMNQKRPLERCERVVLYGQLRWSPPRFVLRLVQQRLAANVQLELIGRRIRLQAHRGEDIGYALAELLREGVTFQSYQTVVY